MDRASGDGLEFLANLRISHPDIIRVLALEAKTVLTKQAISPAAIYQFVRKPLDAKQIGLVVERGLESRELARRHRLLSREFKFSADSIQIHARHGMPLQAESQRFEKLVYVSEKLTELLVPFDKIGHTEEVSLVLEVDVSHLVDIKGPVYGFSCRVKLEIGTNGFTKYLKVTEIDEATASKPAELLVHW